MGIAKATMNPAQIASNLVLRRLRDHIGGPAIPSALDQEAGPAKRFLVENSNLALGAANRATRQAWLVLEMALAGPSWWKRLSHSLSIAQGHVFRQQMETLVDLLSLAGLESDNPVWRRRCWAELRSARKAGLLTVAWEEGRKSEQGTFPGNGNSNGNGNGHAGGPGGPRGLERHTLEKMARVLEQKGYPEQARLIGLQAPWGAPLFLGMVEFFLFRLLRAQPELKKDLPILPEPDSEACWRCLEMAAQLLDESEGVLEKLLNGPEKAAVVGSAPGREEAVIERLFQLGQSRFLHGKYQQAAAYFTAALKFNPTDARLYAHRGDAYRLQGEYERALADFHTALRLDPSNPSALVHRANAYHLSGEQEQALADCAAALELHPNNPAAYRIRAGAYSELGRYDLALADLTEVIALAPEDDKSRYQRGLIYARMRDYAQAVADFTWVLKRNPQHVPAYMHRGHANLARGHYAGAIRDYSVVLRHHPDQIHAYGSRALAYGRQGDTDRAIADYAEVLRLNPDNARAYYNRGVLYRARGDLAPAWADLHEALRLEPENWGSLPAEQDLPGPEPPARGLHRSFGGSRASSEIHGRVSEPGRDPRPDGPISGRPGRCHTGHSAEREACRAATWCAGSSRDTWRITKPPSATSPRPFGWTKAVRWPIRNGARLTSFWGNTTRRWKIAASSWPFNPPNPKPTPTAASSTIASKICNRPWLTIPGPCKSIPAGS